MGDSYRKGREGGSARLVLGIVLAVSALPFYFEAGRELGLALGLVAFYTVLHLVILRYMADAFCGERAYVRLFDRN